MKRQGLGRGLGCGYRNLVPNDPMIHGLSAKGVKTKKPYYIKEPYGLPFDLTEKDKFRKLNAWKIQQQPERKPYMKCSMCGYEYNLNVDTCPQCGKECIRVDAKGIATKRTVTFPKERVDEWLPEDFKLMKLQQEGFMEVGRKGNKVVLEKLNKTSTKKLNKLEREIERLKKMETELQERGEMLSEIEGESYVQDYAGWSLQDNPRLEEAEKDVKKMSRKVYDQQKKVLRMLKAKGSGFSKKQMDKFDKWIDDNTRKAGLVAVVPMTSFGLIRKFGKELGDTQEEQLHYANQIVKRYISK